MGKGNKGSRRFASRQCRYTPYPIPPADQSEDMDQLKCSKIFEKNDWEDATCSVCMEYPHNAVLLLCSSHDKGCRPYMCGTNFRFSNCLDQYKKAYTKVKSADHSQALHDSVDDPASGTIPTWPAENCEVTELTCPLCRGQVKGWTVVQPAREYLNAKKRSCTQDNCSFVGSYKELRRHVKTEHPSAKPHEVDPLHEQKWRSLENERERDDVISTIRSSMPGAVVFGDYVIEGSQYGIDFDDDFDADADGRDEGFEVGIDGSDFMNIFLLLQSFGSAGHVVRDRGTRRHEHPLAIRRASPVGGFNHSDQESDDGDDHGRGGMSLVSRLRRQGRIILGRSGRRRRRREGSGSRRST